MASQSRKRIVIIGPAFPLRGGIATYNERLAKEFIREGHEVILYSFSMQYPSFLFPGKSQYSTDPAPENLNIVTRINSVNPLNWWNVGREIAAQKPDIIISKFWLPFMGPCLGTILRKVRKKGAKAIAIIDNILPHEKRPGDRLFANYFIRTIDGFVVMSEAVENDMKHFDIQVPIKRVLHPIYDNYGVHASRQQSIEALGLDPEYRYVLFFGFIRSYKGLDLLLHAFRNPLMADKKIKLLVGGEYYDDKAKYQEIIDSYDLKDRLVMNTDFIPNSEVRYYFGASDVLALPYKSATQSGITQMALHFEIPMIATNVGGLPEIVKDGKMGMVVDANYDVFGEAILRFFEEGKKNEYIAGVKDEQEAYQWHHLTSAIMGLAGYDNQRI